jgi:hypothetical protein
MRGASQFESVIARDKNTITAIITAVLLSRHSRESLQLEDARFNSRMPRLGRSIYVQLSMVALGDV